MHKILNVLVIFSLLIPGGIVSASNSTPTTNIPGENGIFRTWVKVADELDLNRLETLGVVILSNEAGKAQVIAGPESLEQLAKLGFQPESTEDLSSSLNATNLSEVDVKDALDLVTIDDDDDGLTNTQESWWCTNPLDADSDDDGISDGDEIQILKDWLTNRRSGPPMDTPWASWPFNTTTCPDKDYDSIPNLAERWELGLSMDLESTDRDKFDDGQELFGVTYCPGGDSSCGYGDLPRSSDAGYVGQTMPAWVKAPGNHPLVTAHPMPVIDVISSSLKVETVTVVTTDHVISTGTERSFSTAKTEGTSTSTSETETWNNWMEVSSYNYEDETKSTLSSSKNKNPLSFFGILGGLSTAISTLNDLKDLTQPEKGIWEQLGFSIKPGEDNCLLLEENADPSLINIDDLFLGSSQNTICLGTINDPPNCVSGNGFIPSGSSSSSLYKAWEFNTLKSDIVGQENWSINSQGNLLVNGKDPLTNESKICFGQTQTINNNISTSLPPFPRLSEVITNGNSRGGEFTTSHEQYEEHTVTNGEAFSTEESWGTAIAVDSAHAADFWFTYTVTNDGTDYARQINNLAFNIYLDDDPNPICTYFVGSATCGNPAGSTLFTNFAPSETHTYTSHRIPLSLEQMKQIDLGGTLRVVVEDFSFGSDELFYSNALAGNLQLAVEDGVEDGDENIDRYLIPTYVGDTVIDVLARYFPYAVDENGELIAIWTPEYRQDFPTWCVEPQGDEEDVRQIVWCKHALTTADWWNIYTDNLGDGSLPLQETPAVGGSTALFRFNADSDLDGYSDRSEERLGTDPYDAADFPQPELLAGLHTTRTGNNAVSTLSLLNTGLYDAYGVEAVMVAPDDSITITNNTVGGSGRVRSGKEVVVGSRILSPTLATWTGTARPTTGGYYTGTVDRTYTFTVACSNPAGCPIGAETWALNWSDGTNSGSLNFGSGYLSPNLLTVGSFGLKLGMLSGKAFNGNTFSVQARTPRDTFQYTINREPYTEPVVIVSFNDPQGNHRFVLPAAAMSLTTPAADLLPFSGLMLDLRGVEIVTSAEFAVGPNTTSLVVDNPTGKTLQDARLFLEFIDPQGVVVSEVSAIPDLLPGPSVVEIVWDTATFNPVYDPAQDYIVMAFWTDYEGNILDVIGRPLSSFQQDPQAQFAMSEGDALWNIGSIPQGSLLKRTFTFANTGERELLTFVEAPAGLSVSQVGSREVGVADQTSYEIVLNTEGMAVGVLDQIITIHTSDATNPVRTVQVTGSITAGTPDTAVGSLQRPLDYLLTVPAPQTQGTWYSFTQPIGPDPQTIHPVKVYSGDYSQLWGVGKFATYFGSGSITSYTVFGDGSDGNLVVPAGTTKVQDSAYAYMIADRVAGSLSVNVNNTVGFSIGDEVMILQSQGDSTGKYEFGIISGISGQTISLANPLANNYKSLNAPCGGNFITQYYNNTTLTGSPVLERCEASVAMDAEGGSPAPGVNADNFSIRWTGPRYISQEADYSIGVWVDDGIRVYVDGGLVLNQWPSNGWYSTNVHLTVGWHTFVTEYYEAGGSARGTAGIPGAIWHTQVINVPHYVNVTVESGATLLPPAWNGLVGGVLAFRASGNIVVNGTISSTGYGYRGGDESPTTNGTRAAEGTLGFYNNMFRDCWANRNANGNGGGSGHCWIPDGWGVERYASGGGGGANETDGGGGLCHTGTDRCWCAGGGGYATEDNNFGLLYMGGGGGSGGASKDGSNNGQTGGDGGGILYLTGRQFTVSGTITSNGTNGNNVIGYDQWTAGGGGGGAGGSVYITGSTVNLLGTLTAVGGTGGVSIGQGAGGGNGGVGRVRIDYCESLSGGSNPAANTQKLSCYIAEQSEVVPYTTTRLSLPETITTNKTYSIQFGRRFVFTSGSALTNSLRVPASQLSSATLDGLISGVGTGTLTISLDIGNDASTDYTYTGTVADSIALNDLNLTQAINRWWAANGRPTTGEMDVPVKVSLSKAGQVLLTDLKVQAAGSSLRTIRLEDGTYTSVLLNYSLAGASGPITIGLDVGNDGTVDDVFTSETPANPQLVTSGNLATAVNAFLAAYSVEGGVDIPVRFHLPTGVSVQLRNFSTVNGGTIDVNLTASDLGLPATSPTEGAEIPVNATIHNAGSLASGGVVASFYAIAPGWGDWYIGSTLINNIPAGGTAIAQINWNTLGFNGSVPLTVILDVYQRVAETDEENNTATISYTILTRPDLSFDEIELSDPEPVEGQTVQVSLPVNNSGQTNAAASPVRLYLGNPAEGGTLIGEQVQAVGAGGLVTSVVDWTPGAPGNYRLFAVVDEGNLVPESREGNNITWKDLHVGFAGPLILDSGVTAQDPAYSAASGFGAVDTGSTDVIGTCGTGSAWENSFRRDPDGQVWYQFDHLQPGHFYHLDVVLYECDGAGRQESVSVNGMLLSGPIDLGNGQVHRLSLRLDPALYSDHQINVLISSPGADGAVVSAVNLHDIDYRYADSGGANDPQYPGTRGFGWLDGAATTSYGTLPYQSGRVDQNDNIVRYQFNNLVATKEYDLDLTFWQSFGTGRIQKVKIDGVDSGITVDTSDFLIHRERIPVPANLYQTDGSIVISIERTNASTGAMVNEIALEERTIFTGQPLTCDHVRPTPYFTDSFGYLSYFAMPGQIGQRVEALNPRGEVIGCYIVDVEGQYGFMRIFGEDTGTNPVTPGMRAGEKVTYRVSGFPAYAIPELTFQDDHAIHQVDLEVRLLEEQTILHSTGWNLISFNVESPAPLVSFMLGSLSIRVDRLLGEYGVYSPTIPEQFVTLKEIHAGEGYYVLVNGTTSVNWVAVGEPIPDDHIFNLHAGWNWIGGIKESMTVQTALASIAGKYRRVINLTKTYDTSVPPSFNTLQNLVPGEGYLIYMTEAAQLVYPYTTKVEEPLIEVVSKSACDGLSPTPRLTIVYGSVNLNGEIAPIGTKIDFVTPRGAVAGCSVVTEAGNLVLTHVYGSDEGVAGFESGETLEVWINGIPASLESPLNWEDDRDIHQIMVTTTSIKIFLPLIQH